MEVLAPERQVRRISDFLVLDLIEYPRANRTLAANPFILGTERTYQPKWFSLDPV
jgi:hypothetical protein